MPAKNKSSKPLSPWMKFLKEHYVEMKKKDPKVTYKQAMVHGAPIYKKMKK